MNRRSLLAVFCTLAAFAQEPAPDVTGAWQGALEAGGAKLRLALDISKASDGLYLGKLASLDQGNAKMPIDAITVTGRSVHFDMKAINGAYEGSLDAAGAKLTGTWTQGGPALPLEFTRESKAAVPATEPQKDAAQARSFPFGLPLDMEVSIAPAPDGKTHLAYEPHITNFDVSGQELLLKRLEVLDGARSIASYEGANLNAILRRVGGPGDDKRLLDAGRRSGCGTGSPSAIKPWRAVPSWFPRRSLSSSDRPCAARTGWPAMGRAQARATGVP